MKTYERIQHLIEQRNLTAYKISKDTGIPQSTFSDWKRGRMKPSVKHLITLSNYFNVSLDYLNGLTEDINAEDVDMYGINKKDMITYLEEKNPELINIYKDIVEKENLSLLFDAARGLEPEDLEPVLAIIQNIKKAKGLL